MSLVSLDDFNREREQRHAWATGRAGDPVKNGIACPKCGDELIDSSPNLLLASNPPQKYVYCVKCKYQGYRVA